MISFNELILLLLELQRLQIEDGEVHLIPDIEKVDKAIAIWFIRRARERHSQILEVIEAFGKEGPSLQ